MYADKKMQIAPSMLAADFAAFGAEVERMERAGADWIHWDVMDGSFVKSITFGAGVVKALRSRTAVPFDVHLMISRPSRHIRDFADAGANLITIHYEAETDVLRENLTLIKSLGCAAGISINPNTAPEAIFPFLPLADTVLIMTVEPGAYGQKLLPHALEKISAEGGTATSRGRPRTRP